MSNRLFQVASALVLAFAIAVVAYSFLGDSGEKSGGATPAPTASSGDVVATLLREVVKPGSLPAGAHVVAFKLDAPLPAGTRIAPYLPDPLPTATAAGPCAAGEQVLDRPAWFFWVDDHAEALFAHATRYVLMDPTSAQVRSVVTQGWPPCVNGELVSRWTDDAERSKPENRVYATFVQPDHPALASGAGSREGLDQVPVAFARDRGLPASSALSRVLDAFATTLPEEKPAVVAINGWSVGMTGKAALDADAKRLRDFAQGKNIPDAGRRIVGAEPLAQIKTEIDRVVAGGRSNAVLLLISAHGGVTEKGESFVGLGGSYVLRSELDRLLASYAAPTADRPDGVTFSLAVAACRSADFRNMQATNVARVETCASSIQDLCTGDFEGADPGARWTKAVIDSVSKNALFTRCVSCALAEGAAEGNLVKGATDFSPLFRDPISGRYILCDPSQPDCHPPGTLPVPGPTSGTGTASPTSGQTGAATPGVPGTPTRPPSTGPSPGPPTSTPSAGTPVPTIPPTTVPPTPAPPTATPTSASSTQVFRGSFSGSGEFRTSTCGWRTVYQGTVELTLTFQGATVTGTARHVGGYSDTLISGPAECGGDNERFDVTVPVSGTAQSIRWSYGHGSTGLVSVSASLIGNSIVGQGLVTDPSYSGSATVPFTLN